MPKTKHSEEELAKRIRQQSAAKQAKLRADIKEIGPLPKCKRPALREACRHDLKLFATSYFRKRLFWPFSESHLKDIETLQRCATQGGLFAYARPRGEGKTVLSEITVMWAVMYRHRRYGLIVAANKDLADSILASIQGELEGNDELYDDFPEVCHPVRRLDGIRQRAPGQTLNWRLSKKYPDPGPRTELELTANGIRLPVVWVDGARVPTSGAIIETVGITGALRGRKSLTPEGESIRPDFIILDDPQDRESAKSASQTRERISIIRGDILGLAGPDTNVACVMPCTVIYPKDLADQFLDRKANPQWQGRRTKRLLTWPANLELWEEYRAVRADGLNREDGGRAGNEFYIANREAMDAGASVSWNERVKRGEVSAIQGAMNRWIDDPEEFFAEDQNEPKDKDAEAGTKEFDTDTIVKRASGVERRKVPSECTRVTAFIDVQKEILYYTICAFNESFGGSVIDYGSYPKQVSTNYTAADPRPKLSDEFPGYTEPQWIFEGLDRLVSQLMETDYERVGGGSLGIRPLLIDSGYLSPTVYQFVRQSRYRHVIYPSKGFGRTKTARGVGEWASKQGERKGYNWKLTAGEVGRTKAVQFDPDPWKTFVHTAMHTPRGGATGITLFGHDKDAYRHELFASHLWAETSEKATIRGTTFDAWAQRPGKPDNHFLDCIVGCCVAASVDNLQITSRPKGEQEPKKEKRKKVSYADKQREHAERERADPLGRF